MAGSTCKPWFTIRASWGRLVKSALLRTVWFGLDLVEDLDVVLHERAARFQHRQLANMFGDKWSESVAASPED